MIFIIIVFKNIIHKNLKNQDNNKILNIYMKLMITNKIK